MIKKPNWSDAFGKRIIKSFFNDNEIDLIKNRVLELERKEDKKNFIWKFYEKKKNRINRIEYFIKFDEYFYKLAHSRNLLKIAEDLLGEKPILFKDKINFKYPEGDGFAAHQDVSAGWGKYTNKHVTIAIPLCDTNYNNGCIYFGAKLTNMQTNYFEDLKEDNIDLEMVETKKGDIICFDSYVPHASYKNLSNTKRIIIFFTYTPLNNGDYYEQYHSDKFKNVPPDIYKVKGKKYRSGNTNIMTEYN